MIHTYYLTLLVITALGSSIMTSYAPAMLARIKRLFTRKKRYQPFTNTKPCGLIQLEVEDLQKKVSELEEQIDNIAKVRYTRDKNQTQKIRNEVKKYLISLQK